MNKWSLMVKDIKSTGMTYAEIGAIIHLAPSTVSDLAQGRYKAPRYEAAIALKALHKKIMRRSSAKKEAA